MEICEILKSLCSLPSVSGNEKALYSALSAFTAKDAEVTHDNSGNTFITIGKKDAKNSILLDAHCDKIGFVVTDFCDNGFLRVSAVGGVDARTICGARVKIFCKEVLDGVFSTVPPHLQKSGDGDKYPKIEDMAIDTGLSKNEVCSLVSPGDFVTINSEFTFLSETKVTCAGLDNLAGVATLLYVLNSLCYSLKNTSVTLLLSVQEELGMRGACANIKRADSVISVDASFARYPGTPTEKTADMGKGAMLGHSPVLSRSLTKALESVATRHSIPLQHEILPECTGTNADKLTLISGGCDCALISFPLLNMHSAVEIVDLSDLENLSALICAYITEVDKRD